MQAIQQWVKESKGMVPDNLVSNVACSVCLLGLEKILEMEFICPCDPATKAWFVLAIFIVPAIITFVVMLKVQGPSCNQGKMKCFSTCLIPPLMWSIILFFDGRYFACVMTNWNETGVILNEQSPKKMCTQDENENNQNFHYQKLKSQVRKQTNLLHS